MTEPPDVAIAAAVDTGRYSPCAKSKRGAAVFEHTRMGPRLWGVGYNAQPLPFACTGDERCRSGCSKICEHAEQVAIRMAITALLREEPRRYDLTGLELVHAKVVDRALVAGGGPSCWQCSRLVLGVRLDGVWLYEEAPIAGRRPEWRYYRAEEFHRVTITACGLDVGRELSGGVNKEMA